MFRSKMIRDTAMLTVMQLFLDTAALLLNVFITRRLGTSAIGILTLTGSFLGLAGIISNGNAFLCMSRMVSEELGKKNGNPNSILFYGIKLCLTLSIIVSAIVFFLAEPISGGFFSGANLKAAIRFMPLALISGAVSSCFKGFFNAERRSSVTAAGDIIEFVIKSLVIITASLASSSPTESTVCEIMIFSIVIGNISSLAFFMTVYIRNCISYSGRASISFWKYASFAFPIMGGSILTSALSSTNDALIPMCLRQSGESVEQALSLFGIFEAIVIPTLFFPSVVLCSMSGIIVSESARASASGNNERIKEFSSRLSGYTLLFSIFAAAVLMRFGKPIGELLGGGALAGKMITIIAPVVPFIYLEIVLEAMIKGMGLQAFSSLNYLAEYAIRITFVLVFVPHFGFYGIIASYYASNIFGNCSRFIKLMKTADMKFDPLKDLFIPIAYVYMTMCLVELLMRFSSASLDKLPSIIAFVVFWGAFYLTVFVFMGRIKLFKKKYLKLFVESAQ